MMEQATVFFRYYISAEGTIILREVNIQIHEKRSKSYFSQTCIMASSAVIRYNIEHLVGESVFSAF